MASVFRRPKSRFWHAGWRGGDGRFQLRSTKQTERSKALAIALEWERIAKKVGRGQMVESQVRQVINDILARIGEPVIAIPDVRTWLTEWLKEKAATKSKRTGERYGSIVAGFLDHLGERATKPLTSLSSRDIQSFVARLRKKGVATSTANLDTKVIRSALNRAKRQGLINVNPAEAVDLPQIRGIERGVLSQDDVRKLTTKAKGTEWETVIMFGYYTGARLGDCTRMEWNNLDLVNGTLKFFETKNQKWVTTPLHTDLQKHLYQMANMHNEHKHITPHMAGLGPGGRHGLSEGFKRIMVKAGLDLQTVDGTGIRKISRRTFHALRHSFTSALANAGVSPELRMKLTGHKSAAIHKGYTHLEMNTLKDAIKKLPGMSEPETR